MVLLAVSVFMDNKPCRRRAIYAMRAKEKKPVVVTLQRGFKCEICNKVFSIKVALAGHMRRHK